MKALVATENAETIAELEDAGVDVVQAGDLDGLDDLLEEHEFSFSLIDEASHTHGPAGEATLEDAEGGRRRQFEVFERLLPRREIPEITEHLETCASVGPG